jgi:hypothetical protein
MPYQPPKHHTPEELRSDLILDLEADLKHSQENDPDTPGWVAYRAKIVADLDNLRAGGADDRL